jgi:outer membrane protein insertion porin family
MKILAAGCKLKWTVVTVCIMCAAAAIFNSADAADFGLDLPTVEKIEILGNRSFSDGELMKRMRTKSPRFYHIIKKPKYRRDFLRRDLEALQTFYQHNGFFEAKVSIDEIIKDEEANSVRIRILVIEGPQTVVDSVSFAGQDLISIKDLRKDIKLLEGSPYNPNLLEVDRFTLFTKFLAQGYLDATVAYEVVVDSTAVSVAWTISPSQAVRIEGISLDGNEKVRDHLIERELTFGNGEYFNLDNVLESKQNLYDTGYFNSVEIEPRNLDMDRRVVDLELLVRERKMGYLEGGFGFGNVHASSVSLEWGKLNLFGRGYELTLGTTVAFRLFPESDVAFKHMDPYINYHRTQGSLSFPRILNTKNRFFLVSFYEEDETVALTEIRAVNFSAGLSRRITRKTSVLGRYALERVERISAESGESESRKRYIDVKYVRDARDSYFNPRQGRYISVESRLSGGILGGDNHFYSLIGGYRSYRLVSDKLVFAFRARLGYADPFGESEDEGLAIEDRFFAGGSNSVRGYLENSLGPRGDLGEPVGGNVQLLTNFELRFPLPYLAKYNFGGTLFLDGGNVWPDLQGVKWSHFKLVSDERDTSIEDYMYGIGFGFRYNTPVGPIRLDVGYPLKKTIYVKDDYLIHISLGQIF